MGQKYPSTSLLLIYTNLHKLPIQPGAVPVGKTLKNNSQQKHGRRIILNKTNFR